VEADREKAASVAELVHDLRGSITSLSLRIYMLEHSQPNQQQYYLDELKESVTDLTRMAEELLAQMRQEPDD
jgi:signal transduction histidine kinase